MEFLKDPLTAAQAMESITAKPALMLSMRVPPCCTTPG
jgi:hypothetical protein